jgi:hypothetical protein
MPTTDLRDAVAAAIVSHEWDDFPRSAHGDHNYYGACAICQGDVPRIAEVALAALAERSGDLHGQVTEEIRASLRQWDAMGIDDRPGVTLVDFLAASVLALPALVAAEARVGHAEAGAQLSSERLAKAREEHQAKVASLQALADRCREKDWAHSAEQAKRREEAERKLHEIAMVKVWTNEDGKRFVFADDLAGILLDMPVEGTTTPARETA